MISATPEQELASAIATEESETPPPLSPATRLRSLFSKRASNGRAVGQTVLSLADQGVISIANFVTGVIIARTRSREELGLYMLGNTLVLLMTDFQTSLITTPYMVYAPRLKAREHALYTGSTLIHQLGFCFIGMLGVLCGSFAAAHGLGPRAMSPVLWTLAFVIALIMLREHARRISFARLKITTVFLFDLCIAVGQLGGLLALKFLGLLTVSRAFWVVGSSCGLAVVGWLWSDRDFFEPRFRQSIDDFKRNWKIGKWVFASGLIWAISMNLYPWILASFHGVASTGLWAAALGVISIGSPIVMGLQNLIGPKVAHIYAEKGHSALRGFVFKITGLVAALMSIYCLILFFWGNHLVALLYGRQYLGNSLTIAVLALNVTVQALAFCFSRALFAIDRADLDFATNFTALVIMLTLGLWLVRAYGPLGAAFGLLGANLATSAVRALLFLRLPASRTAEQAVRL